MSVQVRISDELADRIARLTPHQQNELLWRLVFGHAPAVEKAVAELDERGWRH